MLLVTCVVIGILVVWQADDRREILPSPFHIWCMNDSGRSAFTPWVPRFVIREYNTPHTNKRGHVGLLIGLLSTTKTRRRSCRAACTCVCGRTVRIVTCWIICLFSMPRGSFTATNGSTRRLTRVFWGCVWHYAKYFRWEEVDGYWLK